MIYYVLLRLVLWLVAVALAFFPLLWAIDGDVDIHFLWKINQAAHSRDMYYLLAPAAGLAVATTCDFIRADHMSYRARIAAILALLANTFILVSGFVGFFTIPEDAILSEPQFALNWKVVVGGLVISLATELWISAAAERQRQLRDRNWNDIERVKERHKVLLKAT